MSNKYKYILIFGLVVIVAMVVVLMMPNPALKPASSPKLLVVAPASSSVSTSTASAMLVVYDGTKDILDSEVPVSGTSTVFSVLQSATASLGIALAYQDYPGMGYLIKKVGDKVNGTGGAYWQYWVNGKYAQEGADHTPVQPGDTIDWKFTNSQQ
jgi:hypothetical protein